MNVCGFWTVGRKKKAKMIYFIFGLEKLWYLFHYFRTFYWQNNVWIYQWNNQQIKGGVRDSDLICFGSLDSAWVQRFEFAHFAVLIDDYINCVTMWHLCLSGQFGLRVKQVEDMIFSYGNTDMASCHQFCPFQMKWFEPSVPTRHTCFIFKGQNQKMITRFYNLYNLDPILLYVSPLILASDCHLCILFLSDTFGIDFSC